MYKARILTFRLNSFSVKHTSYGKYFSARILRMQNA